VTKFRPTSWSAPTLEELCFSVSDGDHQPPPKASTGIPFITISSIVDGKVVLESASRFVPLAYKKALEPSRDPQRGDIILSVTGSIGRAAIVENPNFVFQRHVALIKTTDSIERKYIYYFLSSSTAQRYLEEMATGTAQKTLPLSKLRTLTVPLPPLAEQKRIVAKLDTLNAKSARAGTELARIETLVSRYKQAVLSKAFSGELTADWRDHPSPEIDIQLTGEIDGRTPTLPSIPSSWCWVALGAVTEVSGGLTKNSQRDTLSLKLPYLRVANVYANELRIDDLSMIGCTEAEAKRTTLKAGDLLVVEGNGSLDQIGRVAMWQGEIARCLHQNHLIKVRPLEALDPGFTLYWLLSPAGRRAIEAVAASSSGLHTLSLSKVAGLPLPFCRVTEQHEIVRRIESAFARIEQLAVQAKRALELVGKLDEAILAKAFRGELVPQDENDEPAEKLLERIRAERAAAPKAKRGRGRKAS
jgi:type I restriction enzyme S subunit